MGVVVDDDDDEVGGGSWRDEVRGGLNEDCRGGGWTAKDVDVKVDDDDEEVDGNAPRV